MAQTTETLDNLYQTPTAELVDADATTAAFFVVSTKKLFILSTITLGLYTIYWFYKNFALIKASTGDSMWPVMRAIFQVFFTVNLFKRVSQAAEAKGISVGWSYQSLAAAFIVLSVLYNISDQLSTTISAITLLFMPALAYIQVQVQATINEIQNDIDAESNNRFTVFNILWCVIGVLLWSVFILDYALTYGWISF